MFIGLSLRVPLEPESTDSADSRAASYRARRGADRSSVTDCSHLQRLTLSASNSRVGVTRHDPSVYIHAGGRNRPPGGIVSDIDRVWACIEANAGQQFRLKQGKPFTYRVYGGAVVPSTVNRSLPRGGARGPAAHRPRGAEGPARTVLHLGDPHRRSDRLNGRLLRKRRCGASRRGVRMTFRSSPDLVQLSTDCACVKGQRIGQACIPC